MLNIIFDRTFDYTIILPGLNVSYFRMNVAFKLNWSVGRCYYTMGGICEKRLLK